MKRFKFTALLVAIALAWAGFASSSFAFHSTEMAAVSTKHHMDMADMAAMPDCPSHTANMKMDNTKCAVSCYGLATTVTLEPLYQLPQSVAFVERAQGYQPILASRSLGVPTPPPNFV